MRKANLEYQWQKYLERCGVDEDDLPAFQRREMRRAFFGGIGQLLILMRDEITRLPEGDAVHILIRMTQQVEDFWTEEVNKQEGKS